jgi:nucleotide-binding universal stress UspA family protein
VDYLLGITALIEEVRVVHVADAEEIEGSSAMSAQKTRKEAKARLEEICARFQARQTAARSHVYVGDPETEIERAAKECQATMVVLGSSSKNIWVERWLGSTPRKIAENSTFPALLIPPAIG